MTREQYASPQARCVKCGCLNLDHVPASYFLRAYLLHLLPARIARWLRPLRR